MRASSDAARTAFLDGWGRVLRAPSVLAGVWLVTLAAALPWALLVQDVIAEDLGASAAATTLLSGADLDWWQEFAGRSGALASTFSPVVIGGAAAVSNLSGLLDARPPVPLLTAILIFAGAWLFVTGGAIDRYARRRRVGAHGFFAAAGVFFFRFLRLGAMAAVAYAVAFGVVHAWLFGRLYPWLTRDLDAERPAFVWRVVLYGVFAALLALITLVVDYAKVRAVVEDRRSMIGAIGAGARFVRREAGAAGLLYFANLLALLVAIAVYALVAPGARGPWAWLAAFAIGQAYIIARLAVRLACLASAASLFQARLAHAEYAAAPAPVWPESPAAESLANPGGPPPAAPTP